MNKLEGGKGGAGCGRRCRPYAGVSAALPLNPLVLVVPLVGPVDGLFYRGEFWFGSSPDSVRFGHIRVRPQVSATHTRGEQLAVTVHGTAHEMDVVDHPEFGEVCTEIYGKSWSQWGNDAAYARITAEQMFTFGFEG